MVEKEKNKLSSALLKKALGFSVEEVVEEYVVDKEDTEKLILNKKKITKKSLPPDISAVKTLLQLKKNKENSSLKNLSDEELKNLKLKLLKELEKSEKGEQNGTRKN